MNHASKKVAFHLLLGLLFTLFGELYADQGFTVGTDSQTADEADSLELINRFRADPKGELARLFTDHTGTTYSQSDLAAILNSAPSPLPVNWWKNTFNGGSGSSLVFNSLDFFGTAPGVLQSQWDSLPATGSLFPYQWNGNIGWSSHQYADCVEQDGGMTANPHAIPGAPSLGDRFTDSGYTGWNNVGENIAANFALDTIVMHMGFAIDWGPGTDGIQAGTGHRTNMLGGTGTNAFTEIGIGILDTGWDAGNVTQVQHFSNRFSEEFLTGYVYQIGDEYVFDNASNTATLTLMDSGGNTVGTSTVDTWGGYSFDLSALPTGTYDLLVTDTVNNVVMMNCYSISTTGARVIQLNVTAVSSSVLLGDVNLDGMVNLLDVGPFIDRLSTGVYQAEADTNQDGFVNLLDVGSFIEILSVG